MNFDNCIFCKIAGKEIPSAVVYEDEICTAFLDINPTTRGHCVLITKEHFDNVLFVPKNILDHVFEVAQMLGQSMVKSLGASGVNILTNAGKTAGQTVFHFHVHVIPRYDNDNRKLLEFSPYQITDKHYQENVAKEIKDGM